MDGNNGNQWQHIPCGKSGGGAGGGATMGQGQTMRGDWVMGTPVPPQTASWVPVEQTPSGSIPSAPANPNHRDYTSADRGHGGTGGNSSFSASGNPYVQVSPSAESSGKSPADTIFKALGRCGKSLEVSTRKAGGVAGNVWQHLKTSPNLTEAALARLSQETKVFAEGGHDKIFKQIFSLLPGEKLLKAFACYISTSSGPIIGTLYLSTARLAFCSDSPLCNSTSGQQNSMHYKIVVQRDQLRAVNPSANRMNPSEKYIQIVTADGHEFWFMGFVSYDKALKNLTEALQQNSAHYYY